MNKILVVDEEKAIGMLYQEELMEEGYDVSTTSDYDMLEEIITEKEPDLLVMDVNQNGSAGLDILQKIRTSFKDIPVILCTAFDELKEDARISGADYFMLKSMDLTRLKDNIRSALELGKRRSVKELRWPPANILYPLALSIPVL